MGLIIDNFAGGGGASTGIEIAMGRAVDIAINHDPDAIAMHKVNHPQTRHYCENVWDIDPKEVCAGQPVDLAWFSPDCKHFSRAKGGKPVDRNIRGLAWLAVHWAMAVRPKVIMLENVEEFQTWGTLINDQPDPSKKGTIFVSFIKSLKALGYKVEYKALRACDYGAPTVRKRFFLIARCDGKAIVWPEPTHGTPNLFQPDLKPYRTAFEIIDWSMPCPSIFATGKEIMAQYGIKAVRPLADNTLKRIARGIQKFVIDSTEPFIVQKNHNGDIRRGQSIKKPISQSMLKHDLEIVAPCLIQYHSETGTEEVRGQAVDKPLLTVDAAPRYGLVTAFMSKYFAGGYSGAGNSADEPLSTVTTWDHNALVTSHLCILRNHQDGRDLREPMPTVMTSPGHFAEVRAFLIKYYGQGIGQRLTDPLDTVVSHDRFGLVTIHGIDYQITDIGLRMLTPRELYKAQGFPDDYIIDQDIDGNVYSKSKQVARCGNAVPPPLAEALVRSNLPELCHRERAVEAEVRT